MSIEYDKYLDNHRNGVRAALNFILDEVNDIDYILPNIRLLGTESAEFIYRQISMYHDASKNNPAEYAAYDNYFYPKYENDKDIVKKEFDYAWLHHIHSNPHHWQYWVLINDDDGINALEIPDNYILEMVCDWMSFSINKGNLNEVFEWYDKEKEKQIMHPESRKKVEQILDAIRNSLDNMYKDYPKIYKIYYMNNLNDYVNVKFTNLDNVKTNDIKNKPIIKDGLKCGELLYADEHYIYGKFLDLDNFLKGKTFSIEFY